MDKPNEVCGCMVGNAKWKGAWNYADNPDQYRCKRKFDTKPSDIARIQQT